jgi:hypothetical protein
MRFLVCILICLLLLSVDVSNAISKDCIACPSRNACRAAVVVQNDVTPFDNPAVSCVNGQCERPLMKLVPRLRILEVAPTLAPKVKNNACSACEPTKTIVEKSSKTWKSRCGRRGIHRFAGRLRIWQRERRVNRMPLLPCRRLGQL